MTRPRSRLEYRHARTVSRVAATEAGLCPGCLRARHVGLTCEGLTSNAIYRVLVAIARELGLPHA